MIVCTSSSLGLFYIYKNDIAILSDDERKVYSYASIKDLDDMEVIDMVISHHGLRSPFAWSQNMYLIKLKSLLYSWPLLYFPKEKVASMVKEFTDFAIEELKKRGNWLKI